VTVEHSDAYIAIDDVCKRFGPITAVDRVSIGIRGGEFFSLLGASGCGKTTLLRMIAGFEAPTSGEIFIDRAPMSQVPPHHRPTNMVFQNYAIFPHLDVRGNIAYGLRKERLAREELNRKVEQALAMVKLSGFEERRATELSGGQRQRVALARALVRRPKVLLLDEPLGALDKKLREEMQLELRALQQSLGITFIFVTHDQEEALTMSDRIAVMADGRVLQVASPKELYEKPESVKIAAFIGQMNFLEGSVLEVRDGEAVIDTAGFGKVRASATASFVRDGATVTVAIRPEKLHLSPARRENGHDAVSGQVRAAAYLGDRSHYYVHVEGREGPIAVAAQNVDRSLEQHVGAEGRVWLSWARDALVLLPPE
jgi:spermidine/putrescine ABC transporter ATP-binding subunit